MSPKWKLPNLGCQRASCFVSCRQENYKWFLKRQRAGHGTTRCKWNWWIWNDMDSHSFKDKQHWKYWVNRLVISSIFMFYQLNISGFRAAEPPVPCGFAEIFVQSSFLVYHLPESWSLTTWTEGVLSASWCWMDVGAEKFWHVWNFTLVYPCFWWDITTSNHQALVLLQDRTLKSKHEQKHVFWIIWSLVTSTTVLLPGLWLHFSWPTAVPCFCCPLADSVKPGATLQGTFLRHLFSLTSYTLPEDSHFQTQLLCSLWGEERTQRLKTL